MIWQRVVFGTVQLRRTLASLALKCFFVSFIYCLARSSSAQPAPTVAPSYAVATIKPNPSGKSGGGSGFFPGRYVAKNVTLKDLIKDAYGIEFSSESQVFGGPSWINSLRFDVEAKTEQPLPEEVVKLHGHDAIMLQALLAERFNLKIHHEKRYVAAFALVVADKGPNLIQAAESPSLPDPPGDIPVDFGALLPEPREHNWRGLRYAGSGQLLARHANAHMIAEFLQMQSEVGGRMVIDRTALSGEYDFTFHWKPEVEDSSWKESGKSTPDASWPSLITALREELGLRLQSIKAPVDTIVIDSAALLSGR